MCIDIVVDNGWLLVMIFAFVLRRSSCIQGIVFVCADEFDGSIGGLSSHLKLMLGSVNE